MKKHLRYFTFLALALATPLVAHAETQWFTTPPKPYCPPASLKEGEINTHTRGEDKIPLSQKIKISMPNGSYEVPAGYLYPWPQKNDFNIAGGLHAGTATVESYKADLVNKRDEFEIAFWYPSGRYREFDWFPGRYSRICEIYRGYPNDNEFLVYATVKKYPRSPLELWKWKQEPLKGQPNNSSKFVTEEFGLRRYEWSETVGKSDYYDYISKDGGSPQIILSCQSPFHQVPIATCDGYAYFEKENLSFRIIFSTYYLPKWKEITLMAKDLILSYQVKAPTTLSTKPEGVN